MALSCKLKLFLTVVLLATRSVAVPSQHRIDDDDDDTPLPLVIWHGKSSAPPPSFVPTDDALGK